MHSSNKNFFQLKQIMIKSKRTVDDYFEKPYHLFEEIKRHGS